MGANMDFNREQFTSKFLLALQEQIAKDCEPIVEEAVKQAEQSARRRIAEFAVQVSRAARMDWHGDQLTVTVRFDKEGAL